MENHYHLLIETPEPNLARGMQWLNVSYSVWFNVRHERSGHLFQGRYKAIIVDPVGWGLELSRYIHLNPVRIKAHGLGKTERQQDRVGFGEKPDPKRLKERTAKLRSYPWSSYRAFLGLANRPQWLICDRIFDLGGSHKKQNVKEIYREYVESALRQGIPESPWEKLTAQTVLGGAEFVREMINGLQGNNREQPAWRKLQERPEILQIIAVVEKVKGQRWIEFRDRHGDWGRDLVLYLGRKMGEMTLRELGQACGGMDYMSVSVAIKRFERRLKKGSTLPAMLQLCQRQFQLSNV
jgi:hypothetical protein